MSDHQEFLARQCAWARGAFGPGERKGGVVDHIRKELEEIEAAADAEGRALEWVDVVILAQDGLLRAVREALREQYGNFKAQDGLLKTDAPPALLTSCQIIARDGEPTNDHIAWYARQLLLEKRDKNEIRTWPDWRQASEDEAIEHKRGIHD